MKKFAFILTFRDRDLTTLKRCLQSICKQSYQNFEIIFIDYGSKEIVQNQVQEINPTLIQYEYLDTRGWFWCKAHALNRAFEKTQAEFLIMADIDMIYPSDFLEKIVPIIDHQKLIHYSCYYLPQNFQEYEKLPAVNLGQLELSGQEATGLFIVSRQKFLEIGGSDEFFMIWGMEDTDASLRLRKLGLELLWLKAQDLPVFHQWHHHGTTHFFKPPQWVQSLEKYAYSQTDIVRKKLLPYPVERPALKIYETKQFSNIQKVQIKDPVEWCFLDFINDFQNTPNGKWWISFEDTKTPTFAGKIIYKINKFLQKTPTKYRIHNPDLYLTSEKLKNFIVYFVLYNRSKIADYYFEYENGKVQFLVFRNHL